MRKCPICKTGEFVTYVQGSHIEGQYTKDIHESYFCNHCNTHFIVEHIVKNEKALHGYWTGLTCKDYAEAEGVPSWATETERKAYWDRFTHITHCSVCGAMFDSRQIIGWKGCPCCLSIIDLDTPEDAMSRGRGND